MLGMPEVLLPCSSLQEHTPFLLSVHVKSTSGSMAYNLMRCLAASRLTVIVSMTPAAMRILL